MKLKSLAIATALIAGSSTALADDLAIGLKGGTLGVGVEATKNIIPLMLNARIQANGFNYSQTINDTQATYDAKLKLFTAGAIADFYPFAGKFRLSGGFYYNGNKFSGVATPIGGNITINGVPYNAATAGTVNLNIDFNKFAPYAGIGWGDAVSSGSPIGFNFELGALYQGKPKSKITSTGAIAQADLSAEQKKLDDSMKNFQFYPVVSLGISVKF